MNPEDFITEDRSDQQPPAPPAKAGGITFDEIGTKYQFFDYKDMPARILAPRRVPEVYRHGKGWVPVDDTADFLHRYIPVDEARIKEMIAAIEAPASAPAPTAPQD